MLTAAYQGKSFPILNNFVASKLAWNPRSLEGFLSRWHQYYWYGIDALVAMYAIAVLSRFGAQRQVRSALVGGCTPPELGMIRIFVFGIMLGYVLWEDLPSTVHLPVEFREPMGILQILDSLPIGFVALQEEQVTLGIFKGITAFLLFLALIGLGTRCSALAGSLCYMVFGGLLRQYAHLYHEGLIPLYLGLALSFMPCGDGMSVDSAIQKRRGQCVVDPGEPSPIYGWCRYVCWILIATSYCFAGLSKLQSVGSCGGIPSTCGACIYGGCLNPMKFDFDLGLSMEVGTGCCLRKLWPCHTGGGDTVPLGTGLPLGQIHSPPRHDLDARRDPLNSEHPVSGLDTAPGHLLRLGMAFRDPPASPSEVRGRAGGGSVRFDTLPQRSRACSLSPCHSASNASITRSRPG